MDRRGFFKVGLAAGTGLLFGWYVNKVNHDDISPNQVPGSGEASHFSGEELDSIDVDAFLAGCARCGVCIDECPFSAIKSTGWQLPLLTKETRAKCPGMDVCGVCIAVCPTSCLEQAFRDFPYEAGVEKDPWWEGKRVNKDLITKPEPKEVE